MHKFITHPVIRLLVIVLVTVGFWRAAGPTWAAEPPKFIPELDIPGEFSGPQDVDNNLFGRYVRAIYIYFIWIVGIVATFMIVFAGVKWVAAAGNPARINDARDMMNNAIIGVIIGLTSVVLLNLLSPRFTSLSIPGTTSVSSRYYEGAFVTRVCNPDRDGDKNLMQCGQVIKIGTKEDKNGKQQDEFCMGTVCDNRKVCQISQNGVTKYYARGNGCVSEVGVDNPPADFKSQTTLSFIFGNSKCGTLAYDNGLFEKERYSINWGCDKLHSLKKLESACYLLSPKAIILGTSSPYTVKDMLCPQ